MLCIYYCLDASEYILSTVLKTMKCVNTHIGNESDDFVGIFCERELKIKWKILKDLLTIYYNLEFFDFKLEKNNKHIRDILSWYQIYLKYCQ